MPEYNNRAAPLPHALSSEDANTSRPKDKDLLNESIERMQPQNENTKIKSNNQEEINTHTAEKLSGVQVSDESFSGKEKAKQQKEAKRKRGDLIAVSMTELFETVYPPRIPVIDGLLYSGTYLFVGAPKVGKSFFMAQLSYHVAMGIPLWDYPVNKGLYYTSLLKTIMHVCRVGCMGCLESKAQIISIWPPRQKL